MVSEIRSQRGVLVTPGPRRPRPLQDPGLGRPVEGVRGRWTARARRCRRPAGRRGGGARLSGRWARSGQAQGREVHADLEAAPWLRAHGHRARRADHSLRRRGRRGHLRHPRGLRQPPVAPLRAVVEKLGGRPEVLLPLARGLGPTALPRPGRFLFGFGEPIETSAFAGRENDGCRPCGGCAMPHGRASRRRSSGCSICARMTARAARREPGGGACQRDMRAPVDCAR